MRITIRQGGEEVQIDIDADTPQEQKQAVAPVTILHASGREIVNVIADIITTETPFTEIARKYGWKPPAVQHLVTMMREKGIALSPRYPNNQRPKGTD